MKLMRIKQYCEEMFVEGSRPKTETVRKWIDDGQLAGKTIGKQYYVEIDAIAPVSRLVTKVLNS